MFSKSIKKIALPSGNSVDRKSNRNDEMIKALVTPGVSGALLFYIKGMETNLIMPPGLTNNEIEEFKQEFFALFERFAAKANGKR